MDSVNKQFEIFFVAEGKKHCAFGAFESESSAISFLSENTKQRGVDATGFNAVEIPYSEDVNSKTWTLTEWGDVSIEKAKEGDLLGFRLSVERLVIDSFLGFKEGVDLVKAWQEMDIEFVVYTVERILKERKPSIDGFIETVLNGLSESCNCPECQARSKGKA